jgi:hypothetical protein
MDRWAMRHCDIVTVCEILDVEDLSAPGGPGLVDVRISPITEMEVVKQSCVNKRIDM